MNRTQQLCLLAGLCTGMPAAAQSFTNGDFQTGTTAPWLVVNTSNGIGGPGTVPFIDIDGPGPLAASNVARFSVGQSVSVPGTFEGVYMLQNLSLVAGVNYQVDCDWAVLKSALPNVPDGGRFAVVVGGVAAEEDVAGTAGPSVPRYGHLTGQFARSTSGSVSVGIRITRGLTPTTGLSQYVDNVTLSVVPPVATSLGAIPLGSTVESGSLAAGEVRWYTFTIPAVASPAYLDIDTEGSALGPANDTELALYNSTGGLVATDDNDGSGNLSQLTFGSNSARSPVGNGLVYNGRDGSLGAGNYYLAVSGFDTTFGSSHWGATSTSANSGTYQLKLTLADNVPPPANTPLGALPMGSTVVNGTLGVNEVRWYSLTIPAVASTGYLDIDTEGSTLAASNDTELGLYTAAGVLVATDDDDGSDFLSQLTFGNTSPRPAVGNGLLYNGRDGALSPGNYYLAVAGFNSTFGATGWDVQSTSSYTGGFQVKLALANDLPTGACCSPAGTCAISTQVACVSATGVYLGDGTGCATSNCPESGACCIPPGGCLILAGVQCAAAGGVYLGDGSSCAAGNCPGVLFDSGRPCTALFNGSATLVGLISGSVPSQGFPHRWEAQAFTLPHASRIRTVSVDGFVSAPFSTMNYIVWRRTGTNRPVEGDQVVTGSLPLPSVAPDPRMPGSPSWLFSLPVDFSLSAGDYYLTIHATDPINPGGDASFGWLTNAQQDPVHPGAPNTPIVVRDAQGVFFWRSGTMPSPGFERFTLSTLGIDPGPSYGPSPQNPDYIYNTAFMLLGEVLPSTCYANCDTSTTAPVLNVLDFACFLNRFAAGDSYANCDGSTTPPVLNVLDFACFLNRFAAGCTGL